VTYAPFFVLGPYIAKNSLGGATSWAIIVTGEAIGALAGGLAGIRLRPRRAMASIGALFMTTALQCALLALHAPALAIGGAAVLAGFAFSFGTVIWDTALQQTIAPEKLARVSAYNWMGAMAFLPIGYAIAGPVASVIGMSTSLWIGVVWVIVTTLIVISVRDVWNFRLEPLEVHDSELAPAIAAS
jgi:MFS family permease